MEEEKEISSSGRGLYLSLMKKVGNNLADLVQLTERDPEILDDCLDSDLEAIWENIWEKMNAQPTYQEAQKEPYLKYRPLKPQPHLKPFYRVAGLYYFHCGYKPGHRELLLKAAEAPYYNFHALRALAEEHVKMMGADGYHIAFALLRAKKAARVHLAPGYILLAESQFDIGCYLNKMDPRRSLEFFTQAYKNLVIADHLVPYCESSMHNAYYGMGPKISNGFGLETTQEMLAGLTKRLDQQGYKVDIQLATEQGLKKVKDIVQDCYESENDRESLFKKAKN
jgi:hypothetical protein